MYDISFIRLRATARLSELHDITELRDGQTMRGTLAWLHTQFQDSTEYLALAPSTRRDYCVHGDLASNYATKLAVRSVKSASTS